MDQESRYIKGDTITYIARDRLWGDETRLVEGVVYNVRFTIGEVFYDIMVDGNRIYYSIEGGKLI